MALTYMPAALDLLQQQLTTLPLRSEGAYQHGPRGTCGMIMLLTCRCLVDSYDEAIDYADKYWKGLLNWDHRPDKSGLSKARRKMSSDYMKNLWQQMVTLGQASIQAPDYHLPENRPYLAIDGTDLLTPDGVRIRARWNQVGREPHELPHVRMVTAIDILQRLPVAAVCVGQDIGEREAALSFCKDLPDRSIALFDRGFPGRVFIGQFIISEVDVCVRMVVGEGAFPEINTFWASGQDEAECEMDLGPAGRRKVRLIRRRFPSGRPPGDAGREKMVVLTTLMDRNLYPPRTIIRLYARRWDVETFYREIKVDLKIEALHSNDPDAIMQEIYGIMTWMTLIAIAQQDADKLIAEKHGPQHWDDPTRRQVNRAQLSRSIRRNMLDLLSGNFERQRNARINIERDVIQLAARAVPGRPNRQSSPRKRRRSFGRFNK